MITPKHNYDDGYIALVNLKLQGLPEYIEVEDTTLFLKSEFHISLLCAKRIAPLIDNKNSAAVEKGLVDDFLSFTRTTPLTNYEITSEFRLVKRDQRKSLIVTVHVPSLDGFFIGLEEKYRSKLPLQPAHITLYTLQPEAGIGILSDEQLMSESYVVSVPELHNLRKAIESI